MRNMAPAMAFHGLLNEDAAMPTINEDKVCFVIVKAREFDIAIDGMGSDGSNESDDRSSTAYSEQSGDVAQSEVRGFIAALDEDEQAELVALLWTGRGDFDVADWDAAVAQAKERADGPTADYLLGTPLVSDHLEEGMSYFNMSCQSFEEGRL